MSLPPTAISCPECRSLVTEKISGVWPFCSKRCKLLDLGKWANETYAVPAVEPPDDTQSLPAEIDFEDD